MSNTIVVENPERKRSFRRPRHRWEGSNKRNLKEMEFEDVDYVHVAQWRALVNTIMKLRIL
jgi:hypothetical protein